MTRPPLAVPTRWLRCPGGRHPDPDLRLFCFPYAGAGASVFRTWRLPGRPAAEVWAAQPPGRENRLGEVPLHRIEPLLDRYVEKLGPLLDRPFAFFGHSLGAVVAYELTRLLRRSGGPQSVHLFLSAHRAPDRPPKREPVSPLDDAPFIDRMLEMAGASRSVVRHRDVLLALAPTIRADLELAETYRYHAEAPIGVPISCYGADDDSEVDLPDVAAWSRHTTAACRLLAFTGGHLFLLDRAGEILNDIAARLAR
jgi:surfactin synthase thioesterase subunit